MSEQSSRTVSFFCRSNETGVEFGATVREGWGIAVSLTAGGASVEVRICPWLGGMQAVRKDMIDTIKMKIFANTIKPPPCIGTDPQSIFRLLAQVVTAQALMLKRGIMEGFRSSLKLTCF